MTEKREEDLKYRITIYLTGEIFDSEYEGGYDFANIICDCIQYQSEEFIQGFIDRMSEPL